MSASELQDAAQRIKALRRAATEHAVEIGRELLSVKAKLPHGAFVKWVEKACEFKIRTAQDLMKLAREAASQGDSNLAALMVPSTLRVYLSKTTPAAVRRSVLQRLENGECVSRSELYSQVSDSRTKPRAETRDRPMEEGFSASFLTGRPFHWPPADGRSHSGGDPARRVAELILSRLSADDYRIIMESANWEVWNKAFVWMRSARKSDSENVEFEIANANSPQNSDVSISDLTQ